MTALAAPGVVVITDARLPGGATVDLEIRDGRFTIVGVVPPGEGDRLAARGATVVPAFVDSHVHLVYWPVGGKLVDAGVAAAVDLAAPIGSLARSVDGPRQVQSGPMITAVRGYPTQSWGARGYGLPCATVEDAEQAVRTLHGAGAGVVKVALTSGGPTLTDAQLARVVETAHGLGLRVMAHAVDDATAARAAAAGVDGLAHTPAERLSDATVALWAHGVVISTLRASGGASVENLRALRAAGATVLYGTDLGNTRDARIDRVELGLMHDAGMDGAAILAAGTSVPAAQWGFSDLGAIAVGKAASFLLVDGDPSVAPEVLAKPREVWIDGVKR